MYVDLHVLTGIHMYLVCLNWFLHIVVVLSIHVNFKLAAVRGWSFKLTIQVCVEVLGQTDFYIALKRDFFDRSFWALHKISLFNDICVMPSNLGICNFYCYFVGVIKGTAPPINHVI